MGMAIEYDPCIKCEANMCSMCKLGRLEHEKQSVGEMYGLSYYFKLDQAIESSKRFIAEHDAALAKKIFGEIEELLKQTCEKGYCGSISGLLADLEEKYTKGGEQK